MDIQLNLSESATVSDFTGNQISTQQILQKIAAKFFVFFGFITFKLIQSTSTQLKTLQYAGT